MFIVVEGAVTVGDTVYSEGNVIPNVDGLPSSMEEQMEVWGHVVFVDTDVPEGMMYLKTVPMYQAVKAKLIDLGVVPPDGTEENGNADTTGNGDASGSSSDGEKDTGEEPKRSEEAKKQEADSTEETGDVEKPKPKKKSTKKKATSKKKTSAKKASSKSKGKKNA